MAPMAWEFDLDANKILRGIEAQVVQIGHIFASGQITLFIRYSETLLVICFIRFHFHAF